MSPPWGITRACCVPRATGFPAGFSTRSVPADFGFPLRMQRELLHAPVGELAGVDLIGAPAIELMHGAEFLQQLSRPSELAEDLSVELHLIDLAVVHGRGG